MTACSALSIRRRGSSKEGTNEPVRVLGIATVTSPAAVVRVFGRDPLRWVVRVGVRSCGPAPIAAVASSAMSAWSAPVSSRLTNCPPSYDSRLWMRDLTEGAAYLPRVISHRMPAWQRRWEGTPMLKVVEDAATRVELAAGLDEIVREGARRMLAAALEAEVEAYLAAHAGGRVDAATGERRRFRSALLPPWCRRSPKVTEVLPLLYLHGLSSKDFVPALE